MSFLSPQSRTFHCKVLSGGDRRNTVRDDAFQKKSANVLPSAQILTFLIPAENGGALTRMLQCVSIALFIPVLQQEDQGCFRSTLTYFREDTSQNTHGNSHSTFSSTLTYLKVVTSEDTHRSSCS